MPTMFGCDSAAALDASRLILRAGGGAVSPPLRAVVLRALAKDPIERYADDDELIAALEAERERLPGGGASDGHAPPPYEPPTGVMLAAPLDYGVERPPEEGERGPRRWLWWVGGTLVALAVVAAAVLLLGGKGKVGVPDVTGQTEQTADGILRRAGLNPVPQLQPSSTVPTGLVISQSPEAGKRVDSGSRVTLIVSGGPASAPVTDVEGLSEQEAVKKLRKAGFKPRVTKVASATVASGKVIATNPPAGALEQLGSGVEVQVSSGPAPVTVPDVTGQSLSAAEATLANAGLELGTVTKRESTEQQPGTVLSQSPSNGTSVKAKSKVDLVVAQAPKEAAVPNVVGESQALAKSTLEQAGFKIRTVTGQTSEAGQVGKVMSRARAPARRPRRGRR